MPISMLGLSARMAAGKTVVSTGVADAIMAKRISFGSVVRREAALRGIEETREHLQDLGETLVQEDVRRFCERVLAANDWKPGDSIVVDGVRHVKVLTTLREIVEPEYFGLMYLNVDRETQKERWKSEDLAYTKSLEELEQHPTEIEVLTKLPDYADLVLNGKLSVVRIVNDIIKWSKSALLFPGWEERNERRIQLAQRSIAGQLTEDESQQLELLQASFIQYLATRHDPFQTTDNRHQVELERLEARLKVMKG